MSIMSVLAESRSDDRAEKKNDGWYRTLGWRANTRQDRAMWEERLGSSRAELDHAEDSMRSSGNGDTQAAVAIMLTMNHTDKKTGDW